jgi:hypothetical protein
MTGSMGKPIGGVPKGVIRGLGLDFPTLELPAIMANKLFAIVPLRMIALAWEQGLRVIEIKEALYGKQGRGRARYFGVRIEPDGIEGAAT